MPTKIAINGFGRIGRLTLRRILDNHPDLEVVAINDLTDAKTLAHLLKYDSVYGIYDKRFSGKFLAEPVPEKLPWKKLGIDIVLECTGRFTDLEGALKHLKAGAKKVIISAPSRSEEVPHYVLGVNQGDYNPEKDDVISMASCTTNCLAPVAKILHQEFNILRGFMTTIHSYTSSQRLLDSPQKDLRRARAAALNIVPTTSGATKAVEKVLPALSGRLNGLALRVPVPTVSLVDFTAELEKETTAQKVNNVLKKASEKELKGILAVENEPLVSTDFIGNPHSAVVDSLSTQAFGNLPPYQNFGGGGLVKVLAWYDNEYGYACRLAEMAEFIGKKL